MSRKTSSKKISLLPHEQELLRAGLLEETTHPGASSRWLQIPDNMMAIEYFFDENIFKADQCGHANSAEMSISATSLSGDQLLEPGASVTDDDYVDVYRHMGDPEFSHLRERNQLPATQPYQTIVCGETGYEYCLKYFQGKKKVDTGVTTIVMFYVPKQLVDELFSMQSKAEDGCTSHGLGDKGGNGLPKFNAALRERRIKWKIRLVKRGSVGR